MKDEQTYGKEMARNGRTTVIYEEHSFQSEFISDLQQYLLHITESFIESVCNSRLQSKDFSFKNCPKVHNSQLQKSLRSTNPRTT